MNRARAESGEITARPAEEGSWLTLAVLGLLPPAVTRTRLSPGLSRQTWYNDKETRDSTPRRCRSSRVQSATP